MAKQQRSLLKRRKLVTWCCLPYTLIPPAKRWYVYSKWGVARWMLSSALTLVIAQRLVRKLCPHCRRQQGEPIHIPVNVWPSPLPHWQAPGCVHCYHGFYGRTALFEVLPITPVIRQLISANTDVESLETHARQAGMCTLFENGCLAVEQGLTTFEELIRVLGMPHGE